MALDTYDGLCAEIAGFLNRRDLADEIPTFVRLAEIAVDSDERFRILPAITRSTALIDSSQTDQWGQYFLPVPTDYLEMQNFRVMTVPPPNSVEMITQSQMDDARQIHQIAGVPKLYAISGETMEILPTPDQQYTVQMVYYSRVPPLSSTNQTNWLLRQYPSVYLYGALLHSAPYLMDDDRIQVWAGMYNQLVENINTAEKNAQFSGATLRMRTRRTYR
ncbi:phage adaptor protein [Paraburkholderia caribensis]|uniref:phage adaptor protein n=1 Tax=Paraburkholderia caribensis TaxID=75105 RepID=UPI00209185D8|nr:hypothetical protein [Paraburkholderia caribensis]MCO4879054.1 hypothetical protein [Paraburkholderia caribensis]